MNKIDVVVADDYAVVRAGLHHFIDDEIDIDVVGEATNGEQAYHLYNELNPNVLLIGCTNNKQMSGLEALRRILARYPNAKIILYTLHHSPALARRALVSGAKGYITELPDTNELAKAIRAVDSGKIYISSDMAERMALHLMSADENPLKCLTLREFEIFRLLAEGCTVKNISKILNVGSKTVANYQTHIKYKLDVHSPIEFVRLAVKYDVITIH